MNKQTFHLKNSDRYRALLHTVKHCELDGSYRVTVERIPQTRTAKQNRALHTYLALLAEKLSEGGYTVQQVLAQGVDREWDMEAAKSLLWKPIQKVVIGKDSTADANTTEYTKVYEILNRFMAEKFGVSIPWPVKDEGKR